MDFKSNNFFADRKIATSSNNASATTDTSSSILDTPNNLNASESGSGSSGGSFKDDLKSISLKSAGGIALLILIVFAMLGLNFTGSSRSSRVNPDKTESYYDENQEELRSMGISRRDVHEYRAKRGWFNSLFCDGYKKSFFCK